MGKGRLSKKGLVTAALAGVLATAMVAAPASAEEEFPTCEVMLDQETCDKYYYGPLYLVGNHLITVYQTADEVIDKAFEIAIWAGNTYDCEVHGHCD